MGWSGKLISCVEDANKEVPSVFKSYASFIKRRKYMAQKTLEKGRRKRVPSSSSIEFRECTYDPNMSSKTHEERLAE